MLRDPEEDREIVGEEARRGVGRQAAVAEGVSVVVVARIKRRRTT